MPCEYQLTCNKYLIDFDKPKDKQGLLICLNGQHAECYLLDVAKKRKRADKLESTAVKCIKYFREILEVIVNKN